MDGPIDELALNTTEEINTNLNACVELANQTECFTPYALRPETYIVPVVFGWIFIVGLIGNGTLIFIFIKDKTTRNIPNMYVYQIKMVHQYI